MKIRRIAQWFILSSFSVIATSANAYTVLAEKDCSGRLEDLQCYTQIIKDVAAGKNVQSPMNKKVFQGRNIQIDTADRESCLAVRDLILEGDVQRASNSQSILDLCEVNGADTGGRYKTITVLGESSEEYLTEFSMKRLTNADQSLANHTRNLGFLMLGTMGVLWVAPESVSMWNKDDIRKEGLQKWKDNVTAKPKMDRDSAYINYVLHPLAGATYYTIARNTGHTAMESFGYSVLMSTFFWEYGFEAVAEPPSIQDLIITPVIGSLLGELYYKWGLEIKANGGKVLGSKALGSVFLFVLSPAEVVSNKINQLFAKKIIQDAKSHLVIARKKSSSLPGATDSNYLGVRLQFVF